MTDKALLNHLLTIISKDSENRSTRLSLAQALGVTDRTCRELRRQALLDGYPVISTSDMSGSYLASDPDEIIKFKHEAHSRALKEFETVAACDRILERLGQQGL